MSSGSRADIVVRSPVGNTIAVVELRNWRSLQLEVATTVLDEFRDADLLANSSYFLVISQEKGFLWHKDQRDLNEFLAPLEFPTKNIVDRYLPGLAADDRLRENELRSVILQWLINLTWLTEESENEPEKLLIPTGFTGRLQGATVLTEVRLYDSVL